MAATSLPEMIVTLTTGDSHTIKPIFADYIKTDVLRSRFKYPSAEEAQMLNMSLVAFSACIRMGFVSKETTPDSFLETIEMIEPVETEGAEFRESDTTPSDN